MQHEGQPQMADILDGQQHQPDWTMPCKEPQALE
jgi:hypothetical protein